MGRLTDAIFANHSFEDDGNVIYTEVALMNILQVAREEILDEVYEHIKHGDEEHQKWLKDKIEELKTTL